MSVEDLRTAMGQRGFLIDAGELADSLAKLRDQELVETLVLAGDGPQAFDTVAITPKGERKVRSIVRL